MLLHILVSWLLSALALWIAAQLISGLQLRSFGDALIATIIIAIVNAIIGPVVRFFSWPIIFLTFGLFLLVVNAFLLKLASLFTPGFKIRGFLSAVAGSVVITFLNWVLRHVVF